MATNLTYRDATKYPDVYTCYWGYFKYSPKMLDELIIQNRNSFVEQYNAKPLTSVGPHIGSLISLMMNTTPYRDIVDHVEFYITNKGVAILNSPYDHVDEVSTRELMKDIGFREYNKMYNMSARTYIKFCDDANMERELTMMRIMNANQYAKLK